MLTGLKKYIYWQLRYLFEVDETWSSILGFFKTDLIAVKWPSTYIDEATLC